MEVFPPDCQLYEPPRPLAEPRVSSQPGCVALRSALQSLVRTGAAPADVGRLVRVFCGEARRAGLHPEQLLVTLKAAWRSIPEVRRRTRGARDELLDRLISACIEEFYSQAPNGRLGGIARAD